jgi:hypothetical protein
MQKVGIRTFLSFRRKPESRGFKQLQFSWTPVFTGVTTFCVIVKSSWLPAGHASVLRVGQVKEFAVMEHVPAKGWRGGEVSIGGTK